MTTEGLQENSRVGTITQLLLLTWFTCSLHKEVLSEGVIVRAAQRDTSRQIEMHKYSHVPR